MASPLYFYPEQRFRCRACARGCCTVFEATVTEAERQRVGKLALDDMPPPEQWFVPAENGKGLALAKNPETGHCVFLDPAGGRCRIHARYGYDAKPLCCRLFPMHVLQWADGGISAEYRFVCPGVSTDGGAGERLGGETPLIRGFAAEIDLLRQPENAVYSPNNPTDLNRVRAVHAAFSQILHDEAQSWRLRLYTAARVLDFHSQRAMREAIAAADETFASDAKTFTAKAHDALEKELSDGTVDTLTRTNFRNLLCGFLRNDDPHTRLGVRFRLKRTWTQLRIVTGIGLLDDLNPDAPTVSGGFFPCRKGAYTVSGEADAIWRAFFYGKLDSMHFCGGMVHGYSYEEGMRLLLASACAVFALAHAFAWRSKRSELSGDDMLRAARLVDFTFGRSPFFRLRPAKKWLKQQLQPRNYAGLLNETLRF